MKAFHVNFLVLTSTLIASTASANICVEGMDGVPMDGNYATYIKPSGTMQEFFESPNGSLQVYSLWGRITENYNENKTMKIIVRNQKGEAIFQLNDKGPFKEKTLMLDRAVFSPDGKNVFLAIDNPDKRGSFGKSNEFVLVDAQTGKKSEIKSDIALGPWSEGLNYERQENFPILFSTDSKTLFMGDSDGIEVIDAVSGKKTGFLDRATFRYGTRLKPNGQYEDWEASFIRGSERINAYAFSPDRSRLLVTFAEDPPAYYDFTSGKTIRMPLNESDTFTRSSLEDNHSAIGIFSGDQMSVSRWDAQTGKINDLYTVSRKAGIKDLVTRNGTSLAQIVTRDGQKSLSEKFIVFKKGSTETLELDVAATNMLAKQTQYEKNPSWIILSNTGKNAIVVAGKIWNATGFVFNTETGALIGKLEGSSFRFSESGKSFFYLKKNETNFTRVDL